MDYVKRAPFVREYKKADIWIKAFLTFTVGLLLSPLHYSLFWFLAFVVVFEVIWAIHAGFDFKTRAVMITASITGWILGRLLVGKGMFNET